MAAQTECFAVIFFGTLQNRGQFRTDFIQQNQIAAAAAAAGKEYFEQWIIETAV